MFSVDLQDGRFTPIAAPRGPMGAMALSPDGRALALSTDVPRTVEAIQPFSATDAAVRKTVGRAEFESAWLTSSGGTVYVITPAGYPRPARPAQANW